MKDLLTRSALKIRHLILFVLCLMYFIAYVDRVNISVAAPTMRKELGLTPTELGLIFSAFAYPYAAMQIAGGWMSDRFGPRLVLARAEPAVGGGHDPDRTVLERRLARRVPHSRRRRRRRGVSNGDARVHLLAAGSRAGLRAGHHPQLRAARRRGHAADRPRDRGTIRMARVVRRARRGEPGVDGGVGGVVQGHAGRAPVGQPRRSWRKSARAANRRARRADRRRGGRSSAACGSSPSSTSATDGRCGCS